MKDVAEDVLDGVIGQRATAQRGEGCHTKERTFEAADVRFDAMGEVFEDVVGKTDVEAGGFLTQDGQTRFHVRRLKLGRQAPFETRDEALLELGDLAGRLVAGEDDLFAPFEERIERVEKFLLGALLAGKKLDVVDKKDVGLTVTAAEFDQGIGLDGVDELVGKGLAAHVGHLGSAAGGGQMMADGLQKMRFTQTDATMNEERVVGPRRGLGHSQRGGMCELAVRSDHEGVEDVVRIQTFGSGGSGRFGRFFRDSNRLADHGRCGGRTIFHAKHHFAFGSEDSHEGGLQLGEVIALDPHLINAVGNNQSHLARIDIGQAQCGKPAVENAVAQFAPQGR